MLGGRLHTVYVKASAGQRVGKQIAKTLSSAIAAAVRQGHLVADNPLDEGGVERRTYRLPNQVDVRVRQLGTRGLEDVPPLELATLLARVAEEYGSSDLEMLYRATLDRLGLRRLTPNVRQYFDAVRTLR